MIACNYLANAIPFNGLTQRDLSAHYQIFLTPAGYVFSIWGLIYLGLTFYVVTQARSRYLDHPGIRELDLPFTLSCLCNMFWLVVWHYLYLTLSVILMLGLLTSLIWIYLKIDQRLDLDIKSGPELPWLIKRTFSVYLGWVSLATILNIAIWLYVHSWEGGPISPQSWAVILLGAAGVLFHYLGISKRDAAVLGVLAWASLGIGLKHQAESMIAITSGVICIMSLVTAFWISATARRGATELEI